MHPRTRGTRVDVGNGVVAIVFGVFMAGACCNHSATRWLVV